MKVSKGTEMTPLKLLREIRKTINSLWPYWIIKLSLEGQWTKSCHLHMWKTPVLTVGVSEGILSIREWNYWKEISSILDTMQMILQRLFWWTLCEVTFTDWRPARMLFLVLRMGFGDASLLSSLIKRRLFCMRIIKSWIISAQSAPIARRPSEDLSRSLLSTWRMLSQKS